METSLNSEIATSHAQISNNKVSNSNIAINFVPGPGQHILKYKGYYLYIQRTREQQMVQKNANIYRSSTLTS